MKSIRLCGLAAVLVVGQSWGLVQAAPGGPCRIILETPIILACIPGTTNSTDQLCVPTLPVRLGGLDAGLACGTSISGSSLIAEAICGSGC